MFSETGSRLKPPIKQPRALAVTPTGRDDAV